MHTATATTYSESARGIIITHERALKELAAHGLTSPQDIRDFHNDMGRRASYDAAAVLAWLGY